MLKYPDKEFESTRISRLKMFSWFCFADSIKAICNNLKQLQKLEVVYEIDTLPNIGELCKLEHLRELKLIKYPSIDSETLYGNLEESAEEHRMRSFKANVHQLMPNLRIFKAFEHKRQFATIPNLDKIEPSDLEECGFRFSREEDM